MLFTTSVASLYFSKVDSPFSGSAPASMRLFLLLVVLAAVVRDAGARLLGFIGGGKKIVLSAETVEEVQVSMEETDCLRKSSDCGGGPFAGLEAVVAIIGEILYDYSTLAAGPSWLGVGGWYDMGDEGRL